MPRLGLLVWGLASIVMVIMLTLSALRGGFFEMIRIATMLLPVVFIALINMRSKWHVLVLALLPAHTMTIPFYGFQSLGPGLLMLTGIAAVLVVDRLVHARRHRDPVDAPTALMIIMAVIYSLRFIHDRPGIVGFGMETGGFSSAVYSVLAAWVFLTMRAVMSDAKVTRRQLAFVGIVTLLLNGHMIYRSIRIGEFRWYQELADATTWMSCAAILPLLSESLRRGSGLPFYLATAGYFGLAAVSAHRSRVFFIAAIVLLTAAFARRFKRVAAAVVLMACMGIVGALLVGEGRLPSVVARALSLVLPSRYWEVTYTSGPMGWEDSFRTEMMEVAWRGILKHPIIGNGFGFQVEEAFRILATSGARTSFDMLALGRSFHNSLLIMATDIGIPAVLAFMAASLLILIAFVRRTYRLPDGPQRLWGTTLIGFWVANFGMAMINGGQFETFNSCVIIGAMSGLMLQDRREAARNAPKVAAPRIVPVAAEEAHPARDFTVGLKPVVRPDL